VDAEQARCAALYAYDLLDGSGDATLDKITALAADLLGTRAAAVSLIDRERQWMLSRKGDIAREMPRDIAFCDHAIRLDRGEVLKVEDALRDARFRNNPLVTGDPGVRFYLGAPLFDPGGHAIGALCVLDGEARDGVSKVEVSRLAALADLVMEHLNLRRAATEVASSQRLLSLAESVANVGHWSLRRDGRVYWSDEVYRIHGVSRDSFEPGLDAAVDRYHPEDRQKVDQAIRQAFETGTGFSFELRLVRPDGEIRQANARAICELDDVGEVATLFGVFQDVTEQSKLVAAAKAAASAKSDFLANMSHELRTPLNSIIGFTHVLIRDAELVGEQRHKLKRIEEAGRGLLTIVNDVLDFSKIEAAGLELREEPFSPVRLVETAVALVESQAVEKGLALEVDGLVERALRVVGDADRLRQVVMNLLTNAVKFTQAGKVRLSLQARAREDGVRLTFQVTDTGIGMSADQVATVFSRFAQADGSISRRFGGTGLGLAISKRLVEVMGGQIEVWSELGYGSTFEVRLTLPAAEDAAEDEPDAALGLAEGAQLAHVRVLAAEDVPVNQELLRLMLAPLGCQVSVVADGSQAVDAVEREPFDLILMDMQMPVMDGLEATRMIRRLGGAAAHMPIVALTANVLPEQIERCRRAGMNDHVAKPFVSGDLQAVVAKWASRGVAGAAGGMLSALDSQFAAALEVSADDGPQALAHMAHGLRGAAGTLGYTEAARACEALEAAVREGQPVEAHLADLRAACLRTRTALAARLAA
jgi:PAS domain S-box-containing protein